MMKNRGANTKARIFDLLKDRYNERKPVKTKKTSLCVVREKERNRGSTDISRANKNEKALGRTLLVIK
jgi:hypothetical protein